MSNSSAMAKKWRTSIRNLFHKNKSPNEQQVILTQETRHVSSKEPQREEKLRWESFENKLAQRMKSAMNKNAVDKEIGSEKEVAKLLSLQEIPARSVIENHDLTPFSNDAVGKTVLMTTIDDKGITRLLNTSSAVPKESGPSNIISENSLKKAVTEKPPASDSVSLKSSSKSDSTVLTSESDDLDVTCLISTSSVRPKESGPIKIVFKENSVKAVTDKPPATDSVGLKSSAGSESMVLTSNIHDKDATRLTSTSSVQLKESGPIKVLSKNSLAKTVMERPPASDFVTLKPFVRSANSVAKASTMKPSENDSVSLTSVARRANNSWKAFMRKTSESDSVSLKSRAGCAISTAIAATKQTSKSVSAIFKSTRRVNSPSKAFANKASESDSMTRKLPTRCASSTAMAVTKQPSDRDSVTLKSTTSRRSTAMAVTDRPSDIICATLPSAVSSTSSTVMAVAEKPFGGDSSSLKSPAGSVSTTSSETTSSSKDCPSLDTDSTSYTDFSGSYALERLHSFLDYDESIYTRESLQSLLDKDELSMVTGSSTHATLDDESITGGIFERAVLRLGVLFLCNFTEDDRCSNVKHGSK